MADIVRGRLISAAPYDGSKRHKNKHLREVVRKGTVKDSLYGTGKYIPVWVSPRGISNAKKGPKAKKNWDKDKHVFKVVVAEFGSSKQAASPFWKNTVSTSETEALREGEKIILEAIDKV